MKRGKKLIILASVLIAVVAVTIIVQNAVSKNEEAAKPADTSVTFLTVDSEAVTGLGWSYNEEIVNLQYSDGVWTNADDAAFPVDQSYPEAMVAALQEVTASRSFTAEDESEYGLDAPAYTVSIDADTQTELKIGNASDISGEYYASIGDGKVYLVDAQLLDPFSHGLWDILRMESIPDMTALSGIDITAASGEQNMIYLENSGYSYTDAYRWFLLKNGSYSALGSAADTLAENLKGLKWLSCDSYNASAEDLKAYGLDTPNATVILSYTKADGAQAADSEGTETADAQAAEPETATFVLEIGGFTDGGYYARIQGSNMVYLIDAELAQTILNASYDTLQPTDVCLLDWDTVTSFTVTLDGATYVFSRGTKDVTGEDGSVTQENTFLLSGAEVDADLVTAVLDKIYSMASTGQTGEAPGSEEIAFAFHRDTETFADIGLAFYRLNGASCIASLDGGTRLTVARADVVALIEAVNAIVLQ